MPKINNNIWLNLESELCFSQDCQGIYMPNNIKMEVKSCNVLRCASTTDEKAGT